MEKNKYSKALTIALIVIIVGILATVAYIGYTVLSEKNTKKNYTDAANEFESVVLSNGDTKTKGGNSTLNAISANNSGTREKKYLEGYEIIGTIEIPKVEFKCVILNETTKRALEIAVAKIYTTAGLNQPGNTVIYGHNYRNSLFFSRNDELNKGDTIYITDQEGNKLTYEIFDIFETTSTDTSFYARSASDTEGKAEVTLSTCTDNASTTDKRLIVIGREI